MDSEEDFNSAQSSDDFLDQDSDVSEQAGALETQKFRQ